MNIGKADGKQNFKPYPHLCISALALAAVLQKTNGIACNLRIRHANSRVASNFEQSEKNNKHTATKQKMVSVLAHVKNILFY